MLKKEKYCNLALIIDANVVNAQYRNRQKEVFSRNVTVTKKQSTKQCKLALHAGDA